MEVINGQNIINQNGTSNLLLSLENLVKDKVAENIKDTLINNLKILKSKLDGLEYIFDIDNKTILEKGFYEILDIINYNGKIIFQALDFQIDGLYGYYDYTTGELISDRDDRKINSLEQANLLI